MKRIKIKRTKAQKLLSQQKALSKEVGVVERKLTVALDAEKTKLVKKANKAIEALAKEFPSCDAVANGVRYNVSDLEIG